jgi:hypothetical protein
MRPLTATDDIVANLEARVAKLESELMTLTNMVLNLDRNTNAISNSWITTSMKDIPDGINPEPAMKYTK